MKTQTVTAAMPPIEERIGYNFHDKSLLYQALTHPSFANEHPASNDNQRLEFLGDAVLGLLTAEYVYKHVPEGNEGVLTVMRTQCVSGRALACVAADIDLGSALNVSAGAYTENMRNLARNLAAAFEAVVGAAWLDGGINAAREIFMKLIVPHADTLGTDIFADNPKGRLQSICQKKHITGAEYTLVSENGPDHHKIFVVKVIADGHEAEGTGQRRRTAECAAAYAWLKQFSVEDCNV